MSTAGHSPPTGTPVLQLQIKPIFDALSPTEKLYARHMARAAWHGSRIVMRQVSAESPAIFDWITDLYRACDGKWDTLVSRCKISVQDVESFLEYAGTFLCNMGNYYGEGDQKFIPDLTPETLRKISSISPGAAETLEIILEQMLAVPPFALGYPTTNTTSAYYPGNEQISQEEVDQVSEIMREASIGPENTRLRKSYIGGKVTYSLLWASAETDATPRKLAKDVFLVRGDHANELEHVIDSLSEAAKYTANEKQSLFLKHYIDAFRTGSLNAYQESQKAWVADSGATVEHLIGFIEPYRDPAGIRSEWEAVVGIADRDEVKRLRRLVLYSADFLRELPWAVKGINDDKGPFEKTLFDPPDFTSIHALAVCATIVFEAANLPNDETIRETLGFKNIVLANRLRANNNPNLPCPYLDTSELPRFRSTTHIVRFLTTAVHELLGHGSGKLFSEVASGSYNFDRDRPPVSPLTGQSVTSWYERGQTWGSVFGPLAATVEECRAILISEYLMDNKQLLSIFGYTDTSEITAEDLLYTTYLNIGVDGLQALQHYSVETQAWGQVHHQAHFAILKYLLRNGGGVVRIDHNPSTSTLTVRIDRSKIRSHGKPALGRFATRLHVYRCTADVVACAELYEPLCVVDGEWVAWRAIVCAAPKPRWKFVQPNTFAREGQTVEMRVYEESNAGIIQSWAERGV